LPIRDDREDRIIDARLALGRYYTELEKNSNRGNRADDGRDEFELAFLSTTISRPCSAICARTP